MIEHKTTVPHSPEQNGVAERTNWTVDNMIHVLIIDSQALPEYWPDALSYALFIRSGLPNTILHDALPYKVITGELLNLLELPYFFLLQ